MAESATPGWYHAQGDPPGTERYWDGSAWTEGPRPVGGVPGTPPSPPAAPSSQPMGSSIGGASSGAVPPTDTPNLGTSSAGVPPVDTPTFGDVPGDAVPTTDTPNFGAAPSASVPPTDTPAFGGPPAAGGLPPTGNVATPGVPPSAQPPSGFPGAPPTGAAAAAVGFPGAAVFAEKSNATAALVLAILGFFCFFTAPVGAFLGYKEKVAIDEGRRDPSNRGKAVAAIVIGLLMTVGGLLFIGLFAAAAAISVPA